MKLSELGKTKQTRRSRIATRITPGEVARAFPAKYAGTCPLCCKPIKVGEKVFYRTGPKPMHASCPISEGDRVTKSGLRSNMPKTGLRSTATG